VFGGLFAMTAVSGMVDAASFLGLGHVFTGNMTGNVLFLGFTVARTPSSTLGTISIAHSLVSLVAFVVGGTLGSLLVGRGNSARYLTGFLAEWLALAAATIVIVVAMPQPSGLKDSPSVAVTIALLALAMGTQIAVVSRMGVAEMRTTVATASLAGIFVDAVVVGGVPPRTRRRGTTLVMLFAGALVGAVLERHHVWWALTASLAVFTLALIAIRFGRQPVAAGRQSAP